MSDKCRYCGSKLPPDGICLKCFIICRWCGDHKMNHRGGRGQCIHCNCERFTTKGETRDEWQKRHLRNMCERPGGRGHEWDEEDKNCVNCGMKKADFKG
jgi:hypothetical protein